MSRQYEVLGLSEAGEKELSIAFEQMEGARAVQVLEDLLAGDETFAVLSFIARRARAVLARDWVQLRLIDDGKVVLTFPYKKAEDAHHWGQSWVDGDLNIDGGDCEDQ